jgi:hypothetical protein
VVVHSPWPPRIPPCAAVVSTPPIRPQQPHLTPQWALQTRPWQLANLQPISLASRRMPGSVESSWGRPLLLWEPPKQVWGTTVKVESLVAAQPKAAATQMGLWDVWIAMAKRVLQQQAHVQRTLAALLSGMALLLHVLRDACRVLLLTADAFLHVEVLVPKQRALSCAHRAPYAASRSMCLPPDFCTCGSIGSIGRVRLVHFPQCAMHGALEDGVL